MSPSTYKFLADALVVFHFGFVAFVMLGGLLSLRWNRIGWLHIPCVLWVIWVESSGSICPLTPLENDLLEQAGFQRYEGGFVDHYITPVLYPSNLTRAMQIGIAVGLVVLNTACYGYIAWRRRKRRLALIAQPPTVTPDPQHSAIADGR